MAIATATAISAGIALAGAGANFAQAAKQKKLVRQAEEEAAKYMEEARTKLGTNYMEQLQVPLEGYEAAAKMNLAAGQQATQALRESDQRAVIGGTSRVLEQQNRAAENLRLGMQRDVYERDRAIMEEDKRIAQQLANLDIETVRGAQLAAATADINRATALEGAFSGITNAATTVAGGLDLYKQSRATKLGESVGEIGGLSKSSVGNILNNSDLNFFQKRDLIRKGQGSKYFDPSAFQYWDPNSVIAPDVTSPFSYPQITPRNPFNNG